MKEAWRREESADCLQGGGEMGALMRSIDWSKTPLGPVSGWSQALRTMVGVLLRNRFPMLLWWGPRFCQLYNDAYRPIPGAKHPRSMGQPASECWPEIWHIIGPMVEAPYTGQPATWSDDLFLLINRRGYVEETHFKVAYSPIPDETVKPRGIGGVLATVAETTEQVQGERQMRTLRDLAGRAAEAKTAEEACQRAAETIAENPSDMPFALLYLIDADGKLARLVGASGFGVYSGPESPEVVDLTEPERRSEAGWSIAEVARERRAMVMSDLPARFARLPSGRWPAAPHTAILLPLDTPDQPRPYGVLIAGVSPHRELTDGYRSFFELCAELVTTAIRNARAYQEERLRAEKLAEIDRAKTAFFSNVSHEFRTPLTLLLAPAEDALAEASALRPKDRERWELVQRSGLRLAKMVNTLLDFSRIEAGRAEACYDPTDLATLTRELASVFRSAIERAGLRLDTSGIEALEEPAYVERDMWEKIVLNLLSNALKFTFEGTITVALRAAGDEIKLTVTDTGIGVPPEDVPLLFNRFHRVRGARSRTHEGTGIGLSLVQELVKLHGGGVGVTSTVGRGSTFTVTLRRGCAHLPQERIGRALLLSSTALGSAPFVQEALRWLPEASPPGLAETAETAPRGRVLLADDNADMRAYIERLLSCRFEVEAVGDGAAALEAARRVRPDLVLSDVMMPGLDGFALVRALRAEPATRDIPMVLLSARAGAGSTTEGLEAGADDYLVKPFSARELMARVATHIELGRHRRQAREAAESANRAKDEFLAMLGHELRNPLAPILTALHLMKLRGDLTASRERGVIERQVRHLVRLVDDLLDISRITSGKIEIQKVDVDLADIVADAVETSSPLFERRAHALAIDVPRGRLFVRGDRARLVQIISNLLANAAKYTNQGGRITVMASLEGGDVVLRVRDTGIGIAPELLPRIFNLFEQGTRTLDRTEGGLGLGLAIVKSLVTLHGGSVSATSEGTGRGTEVTVRLPALLDQPERVSALPPALPSAAARRAARRVLIVDDNIDAGEMLDRALSAIGYVTRVAHDGPEALEVADAFKPNVAVLDIGLPVMDGYELARRLRALPDTGLVQLIALTGYGQETDRARSRAAGFDHHLVKPVELASVQALLEPADP